MKRSRILLLALLALSLSGCARPVERAAERRLVDLLPALIGPATKYSTRVRGGGSLLRGRARSVHIDGWGVRLSESLTLDMLALDLSHVEVDRGSGRLRHVEGVTFTATLSGSRLQEYVASRRLGIPELRVGLDQSDAFVSARPEVLGVTPVSVSVRGTITPRAGGTRLDFTPSGARVSIVPIPAPILRYLGERLNPVLDLSTLHIPVRVERAEVRQGALILQGTIDPAALLRLSASLPPP